MGTDADNPNYEIIPPDDDGLDLFLALWPETAIAFMILDLLDQGGEHHA
jgi:hypothetical protein